MIFKLSRKYSRYYWMVYSDCTHPLSTRSSTSWNRLGNMGKQWRKGKIPQMMDDKYSHWNCNTLFLSIYSRNARTAGIQVNLSNREVFYCMFRSFFYYIHHEYNYTITCIYFAPMRNRSHYMGYYLSIYPDFMRNIPLSKKREKNISK